ncbi:hypothetical protein MBLNU459_g6099t2 [Dothideomycetes sp. NU459]
MSTDEAQATPLSVVIPKTNGPYCPRKPNLREILANTSQAPWTLAAFMAYLSNNHCLETLEFTMDAGRYRKHYERMMSRAETPGSPSPKDADYVKELWHRLIGAYIQPNGTREVNLPSEVRDPIVALTPSDLPPHPELLDPAVSKTYELMEESVLVPFLNSAYSQSTHPQTLQSAAANVYAQSPAPENAVPQSFRDESRFSRRSRHSSRSSPPPQGEQQAPSYSPPHMNRKSAPSALTTALTRTRFSTMLSPTTSMPSAPMTTTVSVTSSGSETAFSSGPGLTDDSGSSGSPINESPMTPPVTPPMSDISGSPKISRDSGTWKKLGRISGWKPGRKKSQTELQ